jgi:hypothetical protein
MGGLSLVDMSWTWANASCKGTSHIRAGTNCQDATKCISIGDDEPVLVAVVSDGAGSARYGGQGAIVACRTISECARTHFHKTSTMPNEDELWEWIDTARDRIGYFAQKRSSEIRQFAATLVAALATDRETLILHIGDGAAVLQIGGEWVVPSWPANGQYASTTFFITDEPSPSLEIVPVNMVSSAIALFSDGIERLALNFAQRSAHAPFFDGMFKPLLHVSTDGRQSELIAALRRYLDSTAVNERTDDDKSLILALKK